MNQAMTFCNFVWMNSECYTTEFRPCLSPKGRVYLKVDNEGKPDLKTFDSSFYSAGYTSLTYCHSYTRTLHFSFVLISQPLSYILNTIFLLHHTYFFIIKRTHTHHVLSESSITVIYRNALVRAVAWLLAKSMPTLHYISHDHLIIRFHYSTVLLLANAPRSFIPHYYIISVLNLILMDKRFLLYIRIRHSLLIFRTTTHVCITISNYSHWITERSVNYK